MAENKTQKRDDLKVSDYLAAIENDSRRDDCLTLTSLMTRLTGCPPHMYGTGIVGFDTYHYQYESGREGSAPVLGFASRKGDLCLYVHGPEDDPSDELFASLGKHKMGKMCLYLKHLSDVRIDVLETILIRSRDITKRTYP